MWDIFISHASEDKSAVARPLAQLLSDAGLRVWFDEQTLLLGDSLRDKIDRGLAESKFGVVVISPHFFAKRWPTRELDALFAREDDGDKVILPVWHDIDRSDVAKYSPLAATKLAVSTSRGLDEVVRQILSVVRHHAKSPPFRFGFMDSIHSDPVAAKGAVRKILEGNESVEIDWPPSFDKLLEEIRALLKFAEGYRDPTSCFHGVDADVVGDFLDEANQAVSSAIRMKGNVQARMPSLVAGMADYWGEMTFLIERSLGNFLTLANFDAQMRLVSCFRYRAVADRAPEAWLPWLNPEQTRMQRYAEVFEIDDEMCSARIVSVSDVYINQYVWGPRWMILEGARRSSDLPITNPWFVKYLIPQVELGLSWKADSPKIEYKEQAVIGKVVGASGEELF